MKKNRKIRNVTNLVPNKITDEHPHEYEEPTEKSIFSFLSSAVATARKFNAYSSLVARRVFTCVYGAHFSELFSALFFILSLHEINIW